MVTMLTPNAIVALIGGHGDLRPVLQVVDVRQVGNAQSTQDRFRLVLSDGQHTQPAMLATQLNEHVRSGKVIKGSVVELLEYICNTVQNKKVIIVLNIEVVAAQAAIVGTPKAFGTGVEQRVTGPGPGSLQRQQQQHPSGALAMSAQPVPAFMSNVHNGGFRGGVGAPVQSMSGSYTEGGGSGVSVPQPAGAYNAYFSVVSGNNPVQSGGFQRKPAVVGNQAVGAVGFGQHGQQSNHSGKSVVMPPYQPMCSTRGPVAQNEVPARITSIAALNPYQGRWAIKGRVTAKTDIRQFHNARGDGRVCSFDLLDADGGEIRVTCFNNVVDQFFDFVDVGKVYTVTKGSLRPAQKTFNHLKNEWEIILESTSTVEPGFGEDGSIPHQHFDFRPILEIEHMVKNTVLDIVGIVVAVNPSNKIMFKNGTEAEKRTLEIKDMSGCSVEITMWGAFCGKEGQHLQDLSDSGQYPVLAVKAGRISDFHGKSVGTFSSTQLLVNPNIPAAHQVRDWFDHEGRNSASHSISSGAGGGHVELRKTISQIKDEGLGRSDKPDWITVRATIYFIKTDNFFYTACPLPFGDKHCNKKVTNNGDGRWHCDRCDRSVQGCDYRYVLNFQMQDHTGPIWVTAFQEAGAEITQHPAKELYVWNEEQNPKFNETIQRLLFTQHVFKLKVKEEIYNDEQRTKLTVVGSEAVDWVKESKLMLHWIGKLARGEAIHGCTVMSWSASIAGTSHLSVTPGFCGGASAGTQAEASLGGEQAGYGDGVGGYTGGFREDRNGRIHGGGGGDGGSSSSQCYNCDKEGHFANQCRNDTASATYSGGAGGFGGRGSAINCFKCGQEGHFSRDCHNQGGLQRGGHGGRGSRGGSYRVAGFGGWSGGAY